MTEDDYCDYCHGKGSYTIDGERFDCECTAHKRQETPMTEEGESIVDWLENRAVRARANAYALVERELREAGIDFTLTDSGGMRVRHTSLMAAVEALRKP